jgi:hypothetical protein
MGQYRQLVEWCHRVAQAEEPVKQASHEEVLSPFPSDRDASQPRTANAPKSGQPRSTLPKMKSPVIPATGIEPLAADEDRQHGGPSRKVRRAPSVPKFVPTDSFDPEPFNRQFAPPGGETTPAASRPADPPMPGDPNDPPLPPALDRRGGP